MSRGESSLSINESFWNDSTCVLRYLGNRNRRFQTFKEELACLKQVDQQGTLSSQKVLKKSSNIFKLDPILSQPLIRVGGRLQRVPINTDARHPVILPKKHHVVKLLIQYYYHLAGHSGLEYTLSLTRQRYCIINGRSDVRNILNKCFSCN